MPEPTALKAKLIQRAPEADDPNAPPPQSFGALSMAFTLALANLTASQSARTSRT